MAVIVEVAAFARALEQGRFFEAHEALEGPWLRAAEPDRTFLKGLIHVAVALYHHERANAHGAAVKHASARRYLLPYGPAYGGLDLAALLEALEGRLSVSAASPPGTLGTGRGMHVTFSKP